jgi:hypothetical protein
MSLKKVMGPYMERAIQNLYSLGSVEMMEMIDVTREVWNAFINEYNLFNLIRTFPIGIPSLLSGQLIDGTPIGNTTFYEISSWLDLFTAGLLLILAGILAGSIFWGEVERNTNTDRKPFSLNLASWQILQSYLLTAVLLFILFIFLIPSSFIVSLITLMSPFLAQIFFLLTILIMIWVLIPLFFSPHGIFASQQNAIISMKTSYILVRSYLPGTGLFLLIILLMSQVLNMIWLIPPSTSWLILVGIAGHAFISTSLLAASFNYYQAGMNWMKTVLEQRTSAHRANMQSFSN